jgi:hypothetical protein
MNNHIWWREHGQDIELWRGPKLLATARPAKGLAGIWEWRHNVGKFDGWHRAGDQDAVKRKAKAAAVKREGASS